MFKYLKSLLVLLVVALLLATVAMPSGKATVAVAQEPVTVTWFVGLGAGGQPEQIAAQEAVVEEFNASHTDIQIELVLVDNNVAYDTLSTLIASGDAPDIVGPVGIRGSNAYAGSWLDLEPLIESSGYDLSRFDPALVDFYRVEGEGLIGMPFGVFPSFIFFNRDLFDAAGVAYPPQAYGEPYADGDEWNVDKVREIGMLLTLDENGNDATSPDFDPTKIVQFGFASQWPADSRALFTSPFGAGSFADADGNAVIPENWAAAAQWYYDGMWTDHFIPTDSYANSEQLASGNVFSSGNVAMAATHLWYTCCLGEVTNWDLAAMPSYNGVVTAKLHADTFRILEMTDNPEAAFEVLAYLIGDAAPTLLQVYGGMPADASQQDAFFATLDETFPQGVNWQVAIDSQAYPDNPSHEGWMPNFNEADERASAFMTLIQGTEGLDIPAELENLRSELQAIFDAAE
ncbi:MAG: extracellular solute-binding protein [Anaerolineae bacterium]|nr:extracellular solute-binding protein [Anaerolineae bacterium]